MPAPLISINVLTYNQETTIARTLDHILAQQTDYDYEIIIGEDASTDKTREICEKYRDRYPGRINLLPAAPNKGLLKNYQDCIAACKGEYIMGCAGDDWWHNSLKVQKQVDFLEHHPDYVLSYSNAVMYFTNTGQQRISVCPAPEKNVFRQLMLGNFISAATVCFRRSMLEYIDFGLFERLGFKMEDYPMWLIMSRHGNFHYLAETTVTYSVALGSISHGDNIQRKEAFEKSVLDVRLHFLDTGKGCGLSEQNIWDGYYRALANSGIIYGNRQYAIQNYEKIGTKTPKDFLKSWMCRMPATFAYLAERGNIVTK